MVVEQKDMEEVRELLKRRQELIANEPLVPMPTGLAEHEARKTKIQQIDKRLQELGHEEHLDLE